MVCIEIEMSDDGKFSVGVCPPEEETGEPKEYLQPVADVDAALAQAKQLIEGGGQPAQPQQSPDEQMAAGYSSVRGGGLNGAQPQGQP